MHSHTFIVNLIAEFIRILILVVMEDALAPIRKVKKALGRRPVLILVVMEDALAHSPRKSF